MDKLKAYETLLIKFNKTINLLSKESIKNINENHFQDSIALCKYLELLGKFDKCYDFGSGNGLPGIIYAISSPTTEVILVEKDQRKAQFLKHAASSLDLPNLSIWPRLAEEIPESVLTGICRAFLPMSKALPVWSSVCLPDSCIYMMKSMGWESELDGLDTSGWSFEVVHQYSLMNGAIPRLIVKAKRL